MDAREASGWRALGGAEGRAARLAEVSRLAVEGLDAHAIAQNLGVVLWVAERDLDAVRGDEGSGQTSE